MVLYIGEKRLQEHVSEEYYITKTVYLSDGINKKNVIEKSIEDLRAGDTVVLDGLGSFGNSLYSTLKYLVAVNEKQVKIYLISENLFFDCESDILYKFLEFEKKCMGSRAERAKQTREKKGVKLGRKKGGKVSSVFDKHKKIIIKYHALGLSKKKIVSHIGVGTPQALGHYMKKIKVEQKHRNVKLKTKKHNYDLGATLMEVSY